MSEFKDSVMIALLPVESYIFTVDLPHMTLVFGGLVEDLPPTAFNEIGKDAAALAGLVPPIILKTSGIQTFGKDDEKVDVLTLRSTPMLQKMHDIVERWNESEWPFSPHVTIGPVGTEIQEPMFLTFDTILVAWGDTHLSFPMTGSG